MPKAHSPITFNVFSKVARITCRIVTPRSFRVMILQVGYPGVTILQVGYPGVAILQVGYSGVTILQVGVSRVTNLQVGYLVLNYL